MSSSDEFYSGFPSADELLSWYRSQSDSGIPDINGHIHTPYSFSAFSDIGQAFQMAVSEGISVLGINDFYTTGGYEEFASMALKNRIFPLFNIEFMSLQAYQQQAGILVNDPNNPGRTYLSGKGLHFPVKMSAGSSGKIDFLQKESNRQTFMMVEKLNSFFYEKNIGIRLNADDLKERLAKNLFRERHIAQAVRLIVFEKELSEVGRIALLGKIFSGKKVKSDPSNITGIENEIRSNLLKAGGPAFVPEDPGAFLSLEEVIKIVTDAGGIPCYPLLLDDPDGNITEYERDKAGLMRELINNDIYSIELIPGRNDFKILKDYVTFFRNNGFIITFGTEHNSPQLDPLKITCRGGIPLDDELKRVNFEGAAVIAAHQFLNSKGCGGYLQGRRAGMDEKERFVKLGKAVIARFCKYFE
ncbi:MAG: hypothetical protein PHH93_08700 [Prolixibacteraceae bacterium]|nr:hypothetical protein [Prolixibacteraceae bacterium]